MDKGLIWGKKLAGLPRPRNMYPGKWLETGIVTDVGREPIDRLKLRHVTVHVGVEICP